MQPVDCLNVRADGGGQDAHRPVDVQPQLLPAHLGLAAAAAIAADSLLLSPLFYFPCFYLFTHSLVRRESPARALRLYADEAATQLPVLWAFWVPASTKSSPLAVALSWRP